MDGLIFPACVVEKHDPNEAIRKWLWTIAHTVQNKQKIDINSSKITTYTIPENAYPDIETEAQEFLGKIGLQKGRTKQFDSARQVPDILEGALENFLLGIANEYFVAPNYIANFTSRVIQPGQQFTLPDPVKKLSSYQMKAGVFPFFASIPSIQFFHNLGVRPREHVLYTFAGSGIGVATAVNEGATHVDAIDNYEPALQTMKQNITHLGLTDRVTAIHADVYPDSRANYNRILGNPPFINGNPKEQAIGAVKDEGANSLHAFLLDGSFQLVTHGRMRFVYSSVGDQFELKTAIQASRLYPSVAHKYIIEADGDSEEDIFISTVYDLLNAPGAPQPTDTLSFYNINPINPRYFPLLRVQDRIIE